MDLLGIPTVRVFAFWYLVLVIKMLVLIFRTSVARMRSGTFSSPEDYASAGLERPATVAPNEDVERARRALQNDLESILPFFGVGLIYALSDPSLTMARIVFAGFAVARIAHTVAYLRGLQPHRSIAFGVAMLCLAWMLVVGLWTVL